ncbi:MAG: 23S rRNA (guanosine(2251)-2'-O)-methyltransferase RlmB [Rhodothermales bacterium]|nr:23S rRNA (guanosine(2251)-2'-O)-methyltransferase RlmB [Rhodothermales bacterium]MBO6780697.1 23S rRNA (guanosine(2251)-2'-O)-methyltransferase RlmB [Rhodothermales bacterium]
MARKKQPEATVIAGRNPVREALERGQQLEKLYLQNGMDGRVAAQLRTLAKQSGTPVQSVPGQRLERLAPGVNHQGCAAVVAEVAYRDVDEMLREIAPDHDAVKSSKPLVLILDGVQDSHNLGAILRSAVAAGVSGVILPTRGSAGVNTAVIKTSAGTARRIPIARVDNVTDVIQQLKERGYWVAGADGGGEETVWTMDWDRPTALVMGSEGEGMRAGVAKACDYRVSIPMRGPAESLNVSVAAGILLFAAVRGRDKP